MHSLTSTAMTDLKGKLHTLLLRLTVSLYGRKLEEIPTDDELDASERLL